ncbi:helix-turn-helix transcriptional regulator [Ruixingdingia sedimenti]|uniref:LuxR family transcriptional regulator n=1 Tax=Ruixingdingia sedimenti TaxID=3073604 RepID=A0ABU1F7S0_9RHOB|nr:LuxR family transcriptional regulator [Xinfangfangia sp. LG-4]MDR5652912.1 LuxR family transcriptional regulator [Xinfangfangia sp. LG-4]
MTSALAHMQRVAEARSPEELWQLHLTRMAAYGFDRVTYGFSRFLRDGSAVDTSDAIFLSNHSLGRPRREGEMSQLMRSPMFRWAMQNTGAQSWRWSAEQRAAGLLSSDEIAAMDQARAIGLTAGYTVSFPDLVPRGKGAMALTARAGLDQDAVDAVWAEKGEEIHTICTVTHLRITHLPFAIQRRPLSPRQRETLEWVAEGKTTQDIAQIMQISPAMVEKHLRLAREALDVETTAHAVAKAAMMNHIFAAPHPAAPQNMAR